MSQPSYTILIIDDEPVIRTSLAALLEKPAYKVELARDGFQGLEMARRLKPDVVLLDVMMPGMSGYEVCTSIRSDPFIGEVPIIMITALDDREAKLNCLMVGADDFLSKPFDNLELEFRLNTLRRVDRYRHLLNEREKLEETLAELSIKNTQLQILSQRTLDAQENERRHVAIELHDEIGQLITGLKLILERKNEDPAVLFSEARSVANELLERVREISLDLRPSALDDFGLSAALCDLFKRYTGRSRIAIHHNINPLDEHRFSKNLETTVFRITQEAITNIARHAGVQDALVLLVMQEDLLRITISDGGKGFDAQSRDTGTSSGLSGMRERVRLAGGRFVLQTDPGNGTFILAEFDLKPVE